MHRASFPNVAVLLAGATAWACTGQVGAPSEASSGHGRATDVRNAAGGDGDGDPGVAGGGAPALDCDAQALDPGPQPLRLLTRSQFLATVQDLFEPAGIDATTLDRALGPGHEPSAFGLLQPDVSQVEVEGFQRAAELVASTVIASPAALDAVAPCAEGADPDACARAAIVGFGARLYRAPLTDEQDIARHLKLFAAGSTESYAHGIELLLRGMLQAPRFLYRVELGTSEVVSEHAVRLSAHELAARLSYLVWGSAPDAALIEAAESGALDTEAGRSEQLDRMLAAPRGLALLQRFLEAWAHTAALDSVVKDAQMFPEWQDPALRAALSAQARAFFDHVLHAQGGTLTALLTSRDVMLNETLAAFYERSDSLGAAFEPHTLPAEQASGVLTLPALLARLAKPNESSPIYRGKFVRELLLCQELPAPPANIPKPPEVQAGVSTRERLRQHEADPACSGCHVLLDPIGFGFEHFDPLGRFRTMDGGDAVDASGELLRTGDVDGAFNGVAELGERLAHSAEVEACMTRQWFRFALERFEQPDDACTVQRLIDGLRDVDQDLRTLPAALVASDAFLYRRPIVDAEEAAP